MSHSLSSSQSSFPKIGQLKTVERFRQRLTALAVDFPSHALTSTERRGDSPLQKSLQIGTHRVGNRWCIQPMEGWDAQSDGSPSELTARRWQRFGRSGAKLIWGGEAVAVRPDGRANPNQLIALDSHTKKLQALREALVSEHVSTHGDATDLLIGLQLTHSGRFCKPNDKKRWESRIIYHHPLLDHRFQIDPNDPKAVLTDLELEDLMGEYVRAAKIASEAGFQFVDVKSCHGYLLHESLSAYSRPGKYGGDYEGRTRLLKSIIRAIQSEVPNLSIGVRLSCFDQPPFDATGKPVDVKAHMPYLLGFGTRADNPLEMDLTEPIRLLRELQALGVVAVNLSAASPYYNPHLLRPAAFPPSDGYPPPEDPLVGVFRQIRAAAQCKAAVSSLPMIGSAYSYLQEFLPLVAETTVGLGWIDAIGLGRMVLSYPELVSDFASGKTLVRKAICRTFSDCTTGPRLGTISGCFPLDPFYKSRPEADILEHWSAANRAASKES